MGRPPEAEPPSPSLADIGARVGREAESAYTASPFSAISKDYFLRFVRVPAAKPRSGEVVIGNSWSIDIGTRPEALTRLMEDYFLDFMSRRMDVKLKSGGTQPRSVIELRQAEVKGLPAQAFRIAVTPGRVVLQSETAEGLRDAVVRLVDRIGFRGAPYLTPGTTDYRPRLGVRLGSVPKGGSCREVVFLGSNAIFSGGGSLYALSTSNAIPELSVRRRPQQLESQRKLSAQARAHGLKIYAQVDTRQKFSQDDPVLVAHPDIRGARTWQADGDFVLCSEHPLVKKWLAESIEGVFRADPDLTGVVIIIGGEGFYHCFMRAYGVGKGHTNCPRCEKLGAEVVVSNLCNELGAAARSVRPDAEVVVWPYSAGKVWSSDPAQVSFIERLKPGVAVLTEMEKDEIVEKPGGVRKSLWDYSIDLIGPGPRARRQIEACRKAGIPIYLKSEPEQAFEAVRLPHVPCLDRWFDRNDSLASCGGDGAFVFPALRSQYASSASEVSKYLWWSPVPTKEALLRLFAQRLAGEQAGPHLRQAWRHVSDAIELSPLIPPYYTGPQYLGPAHPMIADPSAKVPQVFYGYHLYMAEVKNSEGTLTRPTFFTKPFGVNPPVLEEYYRKMEVALLAAVRELDAAAPRVTAANRLMFDTESNSIRWFYHTTRATANFYESCRLRDTLATFLDGKNPGLTLQQRKAIWLRWQAVLNDERENARSALPLAQSDMRLDFYYGGDHSFAHTATMIEAKLALLEAEISTYLPAMAVRCGWNPQSP